MPNNDSFSCLSKEPLIKLDENGSAPIIKYRIPRETSYFAKGFIPLDVPYKCFKEKFRSEIPVESTKPNTVDEIVADLRAKAKIFDSVSKKRVLSSIKGGKLLSKNNSSLSKIGGNNSNDDKIKLHGRIQPVTYEDLSEIIITNDVEIIYGSSFYGYMEAYILPQRKKLDPRIFLIEEYEIRSTYGDYGAAQVIKTMDFAPNEERTITISSYKRSETSTGFSKNILDSFSEESAKEMESMVENEGSTNTTDSTEVIKSAEASASIKAGFGPIGGSASGSTSKNSTANSARDEMARRLSTSMDKHVAKSSANREMEINDSTTTTTSEGEESTITRVIKNPNFKTMNLVFRQMEQEYLTVIFLKNVEIGFCYDGPDTIRKVKLYELDELLDDIIDSDQCKNEIRCNILTQLLRVKDMNGNIHQFIEEVTEQIYKCTSNSSGSTSVVEARDANNNLLKKRYWKKRKNIQQDLSELMDTVRNGILNVPGIIIDAKKRILRTDGIVADAILGHGEALDCFNQKLQNEATRYETLKNNNIDIKSRQEQLKIDIINSFSDPNDKVTAFRKLFIEKPVDDSED